MWNYTPRTICQRIGHEFRWLKGEAPVIAVCIRCGEKVTR